MSGRNEDGTWRDADGEPIEPWVRILAEACTDGVWGRESAFMWLDDLPIPEALRERFRRWNAWYAASDDDIMERDPNLDYPAFAAEGLAIARAVKAELPHWTVIYFDKDKRRYRDRTQPRAEYEHEITLP